MISGRSLCAALLLQRRPRYNDDHSGPVLAPLLPGLYGGEGAPVLRPGGRETSERNTWRSVGQPAGQVAGAPVNKQKLILW